MINRNWYHHFEDISMSCFCHPSWPGIRGIWDLFIAVIPIFSREYIINMRQALSILINISFLFGSMIGEYFWSTSLIISRIKSKGQIGISDVTVRYENFWKKRFNISPPVMIIHHWNRKKFLCGRENGNFPVGFLYCHMVLFSYPFWYWLFYFCKQLRFSLLNLQPDLLQRCLFFGLLTYFLLSQLIYILFYSLSLSIWLLIFTIFFYIVLFLFWSFLSLNVFCFERY